MITDSPVLLYVDDNRDDIVLMEAAVRMAEIPFSLRTFTTITAATAYLTGQGDFADRTIHPFPKLVLLDYHLGGITSTEALPELRKLPECGALPFVIFSGSESGDGLNGSEQAGSEHFLVKPSGLHRLEFIVKALYDCANSTPPCCLALRALPEYQRCAAPARDTHSLAAA
ncbi:MAG: hypothetical protein QOJ40_2039 [Verrucomicrobiota bacterium]